MKLINKSKPFHWTYHARDKMRFYRLSESRVRRVLHTPGRIERGIAPKTIAFMQSTGNKKRPHELWVMIAEEPKRRKVISAWVYPGVTKLRDELSLGFLAREYGEFVEANAAKTRRWRPI